MKHFRLFLVALTVSVTVIFAGCDLQNNENEPKPEFTIDPDMYPVVAYANETAVTTEAYSFPYAWKAEIPEEATTWLSTTPESGEAGKNPCTFNFNPNTTGETRSTAVIITFNDGTIAKIHVVQVASDKPQH